MIKTFPLLLLAAVLSVDATAQSGRRNVNPPTPVEPALQPPLNSQPERLPPMPEELRALPEKLMNRQLQSLDKGSFSLADFGGKILVLNIWASWCGPCRNEVPEYEKVRKEYAARGIEFIGLTTEDPRTASDRVNKFVREFKFGFRLGWADRETARTLMNGRNAVPQTLVIAADGRIISHWSGYARGEGGDRLRQTIDRALSEASRAGH